MTATAEDRAAAARAGMTIAWWAARAPDRVAIVSGFGDRTFGTLNARANQLIRALRRMGLAAGDAVALVCTNRPEFAEVMAACLRGGLRLTPINWHLTEGEAAYIADDCEAKALVGDARLADLVAGAASGAPRATARLAIGGAIEGFDDYETAIAGEDPTDIDDPALGLSMLYTSGTTGRPKGVYRSPAAAAASAVLLNIYGYGEDGTDLHLCTGPLYHAAPLAFSLNAPLTYGVGTVLMDGWDAEETLRLVDEHRITHSHMVPTMFHRLLALPEGVRAKYDLGSLRYVLHGAAPCPVAVKQALIEWLGPVVFEYYAATEGVGCFVDSPTWLNKPGTVGKPAEGQVVVGDEEGNPVPANEVGLVYIRAPQSGRFEYFKDRSKTESAYRGEYFTLGDMGYQDEDGFLFLTDRTANLIISGGVNIYPAEVDAVLLEHPAVGDAAVIGVPNEEWGEEVKAVVELRSGVEASDGLAAELIEHCRSRLANYKCPRTVDFVDRLPRQDNGKIYKRLLRDQYRARAAATEAAS